MMASTSYTAADARREYPPKLRRAALLELGAKFGYTESSLRKLIEGDDATLKRRTFAGQTQGYFDREEFLTCIA